MSLAVVFPGQGARELDEAVRAALSGERGRALVAHAAREAGLADVEALFAKGGRALERTEVAQPVLAAVCLGALGDARLEPSIVLGHSLGELVAWCVARAVPALEAVSLVAARARAMAAACAARPGAMLAVGAPRDAIARALSIAGERGHASIAAYNGPGETVLAGDEAAVRALERALGGTRLRTAGAFHTPLMGDAVAPLEARLAALSTPRDDIVGAPTIHIAWACVEGVDAPRGPGDERRHLARALVEPLDFGRAVEGALALGADELVVVGPPSSVLAPLRGALGAVAGGRDVRVRVLARAR